MNGRERVQAVLAGKVPDRVPVCLHNSHMAAAQAGISMAQYRKDPQAIAKAHLLALEMHGQDSLYLTIDTALLAEAMGAKSEHCDNEPARVVAPAIQSLDEVDRLKVADPAVDGRLPVLVEATQLVAERVGAEVAIRAGADQGPFDLACLVFGIDSFLTVLACEPDHPGIEALLNVCYESHLALHRALFNVGAHYTSSGESLAGPDVVSPAMYERFARPHQEKMVKKLAAEGIFTVVHICGNTTKILKSLAEYDYCGFEFDHKTDSLVAKQTVGARHVLFGNVDPSGVLALGTPDLVREKTRELISVWKPEGRFVLNSGCALPSSTPPENIRAFIETAHEFGVYT
jgi:MtaA/CmuA family methyltransferase